MTVTIRSSARIFMVLILACSGSSAPAGPVRSVPICSGITLAASYLAVAHDQSPGFRFVLYNRTSRAIKLAEPIPSSSHWYARLHGRWLWRASSGAGGSLADARNEQGRVVVYPGDPNKGETEWITLPAHKSRQWIETQQENPVLRYQPGCAMCSYPGESQYRVVFAYAYLAAASTQPGSLACGLRSAPVPLPPKS
jgi:hypothetical protein